jgi:hypothetical protein
MPGYPPPAAVELDVIDAGGADEDVDDVGEAEDAAVGRPA